MGEAVERALRNDPVYLGAAAELGVSQARSSQAFSALMPQLSASVNASRNRRDYSQNTAGGIPNNVLENYNSDSAQLNFTQPLWHLDNYFAMREADSVVAQSDQLLLSAGQDVLVRLAQAWFDIMQAHDEILLAESKAKLARYQLDQAIREQAKGVMSLTDSELARGKHEVAIAEQSAAEAQLNIKLAALEQIIGPAVITLPPELPENPVMPMHKGESFEHWGKLAEEHNPAILAARYALNAANEEVRKRYAGHEPTLDIVASYGKSAQGAGITGGQAGFSSKTNTVGVQFNVPLFSGGGQVAKVREANALKEKAAQDLELAIRNARSSVKQDWFTWASSDSMQAAAGQNMKSTAFALKGAELGKARGIKSGLDVLQAQVQFDIAARDFRKAQYDAFMSYFKLLAVTGQLNGTELMRLDRLAGSSDRSR